MVMGATVVQINPQIRIIRVQQHQMHVLGHVIRGTMVRRQTEIRRARRVVRVISVRVVHIGRRVQQRLNQGRQHRQVL